MIKVIIESPYAGNIKENVKYAKECLLDSLNRGESPIASHLLYTQVLKDSDINQRRMGINAGLVWLDVTDKHIFYADLGYSPGMLEAFAYSKSKGIAVEERYIR